MIDHNFKKCGFFPNSSIFNTNNQKPIPEEQIGISLLKDNLEIHVKNISVSVDEHQKKTGTYGGTIFQIGNYEETKEYKGLKIGLEVYFKKENMLHPL